MKIEVNIDRSRFLILLSSILLLASGIFVYAYNADGVGGNPAVFGHDASELGPGRFSNTSSSDEWTFPGSVIVNDLSGENLGNRMVFVDESGKLSAADYLPGVADTSTSISDEFIGGFTLPWVVAGTARGESEYNIPGIVNISTNGYMYLPDAISSKQGFDITFVLRSFAGFSLSNGFTIGLFESATTSGGYSNSPKIVFERKDLGYTSSTSWLAVTAFGSASADKRTTITNVPLSGPNQMVKFRILRADESTIQFFINDVLVATHTEAIPDTYDSMELGIINSGNLVQIDSFSLSLRDLNRKSLQCSSVIYDSTSGGADGASTTPGFVIKNVPSVCLGPSGCVIKQEIYSRSPKTLLSSAAYSYKQEANGRWTSSSLAKGKSYQNGDRNSDAVIPNKFESNIILRDDYTSTALRDFEIVDESWTFRDSHSSRDQKVYICTYT